MVDVSVGDFVSWTTEKGAYVGEVSSVIRSGRASVVTPTGGQQMVDVSEVGPVANVRVYVDNQDGTYSRSDRLVPVRFAMLRKRSKPETKAEEKASAKVKESLKKKADEHNAKVGNAKTKRTNVRTLAVVYDRGAAAYSTNPGSVRPTVSSPAQWAMARVNSFLYALRNGRFRRGKHDTDLLPAGHPQSTKKGKAIEKGPKCRQANETRKQCVERKTRELIEVDGMEADQAYAVANSMCDKSCSEQYDKNTHVTNFPKKGDNKKVSLRNSQYNQFPLAEAEKLKNDWPSIWKRGGNILGNTQYQRLKKVHQQMGEAKTPTDEMAIRLREAWMARHLKDHRLAGIVAQIKWLGIGSRGISHMRKVLNDEKKRLRDRGKK